MADLTDHERRILAYLDQKGPTHRSQVVADLASPESRIGRGIFNGSNSGIPMIMGRWCKGLQALGYVEVRTTGHGRWYDSHAITNAGRDALRRREP